MHINCTEQSKRQKLLRYSRFEETSSLNTGSELDYLRYVNMICDASDAFWSSNIVMFLLRLKRILE